MLEEMLKDSEKQLLPAVQTMGLTISTESSKSIKSCTSEEIVKFKAIQSSMEQERERLDAEVCRLTEALMTMNDQGEAKSRGKLRVTTSAPGGLACHTPAPNAEEPSRCLKYWIVI